MAMAASSPPLPAYCGPAVTVPKERCWEDGPHRLGPSTRPSSSAADCCAQCMQTAGCEVWVHWRMSADVPFHCTLYSAIGQTVPGCRNATFQAGHAIHAPPPPTPPAPPGVQTRLTAPAHHEACQAFLQESSLYDLLHRRRKM